MSHYSPLIAERAELMGVSYDDMPPMRRPELEPEAETLLERQMLERIKEMQKAGDKRHVEGSYLLGKLVHFGIMANEWLDDVGAPDSAYYEEEF